VARKSKSTDAAPAPPQWEWIDTDAGVRELIDTLVDQPEYAIDTEFHRERTYYPDLALIQIGWADRIVLVDPKCTDVTAFARLFATSSVAVFHAADQDLEVLQHAVGAIPTRFWDTQLAAGFVGFSTPSLSSLAERVVGVHLSKGDRLTDWTQRPLTAGQKNYAASDVQYLLAIRAAIVEQLIEAGRLEWVEEELAVLSARLKRPVVPEQSWWRLKDGRILRGRDRLVAQELCAWRERRAQQDDRPVRFVLPDLAVLAMAQTRPTSIEQLTTMRGVDGRFLKGGAGRELLALIEDAGQLPATQLRVPEPEEFDRRLRPALTLVSAWIAQLARDAKIDTALLATRADLIAFLRDDDGARLNRGWRAEVVGSAMRQLVSGEAALAFEPSGGLLLESRSHQTLRRQIATPSAPWVLDAPDHRLDVSD
jgi:ribonuclease D